MLHGTRVSQTSACDVRTMRTASSVPRTRWQPTAPTCCYDTRNGAKTARSETKNQRVRCALMMRGAGPLAQSETRFPCRLCVLRRLLAAYSEQSAQGSAEPRRPWVARGPALTATMFNLSALDELDKQPGALRIGTLARACRAATTRRGALCTERSVGIARVSWYAVPFADTAPCTQRLPVAAPRSGPPSRRVRHACASRVPLGERC